MADIRDLAKQAGIADAEIDAFEAAMRLVEAVDEGRHPRPGGPGCLFPHCACNLPWKKCEKKG